MFFQSPSCDVAKLKMQAAIQNCQSVASSLGEEYDVLQQKVERFFAKQAEKKSSEGTEFEFKYECKYLYKYSVEV